jgi:formate C-acetyltransferase
MNLDVRDFVYKNITPYTGDAGFLAGPTQRTKELWDECLALLKQERKNNGCLSVDSETISNITSHKP